MRASCPFTRACLLFAILCGAYFLVFFQRLSLGVVMPSLAAGLALSPAMTGWLGSAFLYAYAFTQIPAGLLVDSRGPRRALLLLFAVGGAGGVLFASAQGFAAAFTGRVLTGVGMAVVTTASFKVMNRWFRPGLYPRLVAIFMAVGGLGTFFAAAPLAAMDRAWGWRAPFWGIAVFSLLWIELLRRFVRDAPSPEQAAALGLEAPADAAPRGGPGPDAFRILFASRQYRTLLLWYLSCGSLFFSFAGLWAGDYYTRVHGLAPEACGALLSLGALSLILGTPAGAWLAGRLRSAKTVLLLGSLCALGSALSLCLAAAPLPRWALWLQFGGICLAGNATASVLFTAARDAVPPAVLGLATAVLSFSMFVCSACLQVLVGAALEHCGHSMAIGPAYARAFLFYPGLAAVSLAAGLRLRDASSFSVGRNPA